MQPPAHPHDEAQRIEMLRSLNILDTPPEERFDRLTRLACRTFAVPIATVTLIDSGRQWFKSRVGLAKCETSRDLSFCGHAILQDGIFLVEDSHSDPRFSDHPFVLGDPFIRFYAGCPLRVENFKMGTFCLIGREARAFTGEDRTLLKDLASMAEQELLSEHLVSTDELTHLTNRRGMMLLARQALAACKRAGEPATLVYFDLNDFKQINDCFGHAEGDRTLSIFAETLASVFRQSDVIGRIGGDEFAVLQVGSSLANSGNAVTRVRESIAERGLRDCRGYDIRFSSGKIEFDPARHASIDDLLAEADAAMYADKAVWRKNRPASN
jgi:diguanylate cyclase (GGDEF)-like protein